MSDIVIWEGSQSFSPGDTPFAFYDQDLDFQQDADKVIRYCATRLGYLQLDVELNANSYYACFEEAVTIYGNEIFQYKIRENFISMEGASSEGTANNKLVNSSLDRIISITDQYGTEAEVGGKVTKYKGAFDVAVDQQEYDLDAWALEQGITGSIEVRKVFYESPPAILRYFDPYAGTGTGVQSLMDAFDFGSYSPGVNFLLMPASFDALKIQAIEFNDQIRRSAYSFELINNKLKIFPIPKTHGKMFFEYYKDVEKANAGFVDGEGLITNVGEVPYENPVYADINSVGRHWIYNYTLALAKELLGYVRGKYTTIPIPGAEATLNQADLLADARTEQERLLTQLREMLEQSSRTAQLERKAGEARSTQEIVNGIPLTIYVG
jgi:hypothetical protein